MEWVIWKLPYIWLNSPTLNTNEKYIESTVPSSSSSTKQLEDKDPIQEGEKKKKKKKREKKKGDIEVSTGVR